MKTFITTSPPGSGTRGNAWQAILLGTLLAVSAGAQAAGTTAGDIISNQATLSYAVGGTTQPNVLSDNDADPNNGISATTFAVDNKVNLTLVENGTSATTVAAGAQDQATSFTLTNTGNFTQGYTLTAANIGSTVFGTADAFNVANFQIYIDVNGDGLLDGGDTLTTGSIASLAPDASIKLLVVADIPMSQANGTQSAISLTATAVEANTLTALAEAPNTQSGVEIVFADAATTETLSTGGTDPGQTAGDAAAVAVDAYKVQTAVLSMLKTAAVICDPINADGAGKMSIPGAVVRWTITITNSGTASASLASISDPLQSPATTFDPDLITGAGGAAACEFAAAGAGTPASVNGNSVFIDPSVSRPLHGTGGNDAAADASAYFTGASDTDGVTHAAGTLSINFATAMPAGAGYSAGELKAGESVVVYFNVGIN